MFVHSIHALQETAAELQALGWTGDLVQIARQLAAAGLGTHEIQDIVGDDAFYDWLEAAYHERMEQRADAIADEH